MSSGSRQSATSRITATSATRLSSWTCDTMPRTPSPGRQPARLPALQRGDEPKRYCQPLRAQPRPMYVARPEAISPGPPPRPWPVRTFATSPAFASIRSRSSPKTFTTHRRGFAACWFKTDAVRRGRSEHSRLIPGVSSSSLQGCPSSASSCTSPGIVRLRPTWTHAAVWPPRVLPLRFTRRVRPAAPRCRCSRFSAIRAKHGRPCATFPAAKFPVSSAAAYNKWPSFKSPAKNPSRIPAASATPSRRSTNHRLPSPPEAMPRRNSLMPPR